MLNIFPDQLPWYVAGPALGLLTVALFAIANQPLGASGAYVQTSNWMRRFDGVVVWRVFYFAGLFLGGLLMTQVLSPSRGLRSGYDALTADLPLGLVIPMVFGGAALLGYGAAVAGGCTSGHGICGTAQRSPASFTVTGTFMATAIATTFVLESILGGLR